MKLNKLRIGGVPEHFNFPWIKAIEKGLLNTQNIEVIWYNFPGGTGAMSLALKNDEIDLALLLTEGAVKEIATGAPFKIVTTYVDTPLIWGVHSSRINLQKDKISSYRFAVSRFGSGSHLMAYVYASKNIAKVQDDKMVVVGDINGARKALSDGSADLFLWEKFMTKPLVDNGEFLLFDEIPTPWPCFMLVSNNNYYVRNKMLIGNTLDIFYKSIADLNKDSALCENIADYYHLKKSDVEVWKSKTKWVTEKKIDNLALQKVAESLYKLGILNSIPNINDLYFKSE